MKNEIMQRFNIVLNALNNISVSGKSNLANLSGSIAMIEEMQGMIGSIDFAERDAEAKEG